MPPHSQDSPPQDSPSEDRFEALLQAHGGILRKVASTYCRNPADRDDLMQEIATQWWRAYPRFDARCAFSTWAYRIALNVAISHVRRESARLRETVPAEPHHLEVADDAAPSEALLQLQRFIEGLDPLNKALVLLYLDGHSHQEIAEVLGITAGHAATKIGRVKERLRSTSSR